MFPDYRVRPMRVRGPGRALAGAERQPRPIFLPRLPARRLRVPGPGRVLSSSRAVVPTPGCQRPSVGMISAESSYRPSCLATVDSCTRQLAGPVLDSGELRLLPQLLLFELSPNLTMQHGFVHYTWPGEMWGPKIKIWGSENWSVWAIDVRFRLSR